MTSPRRTLTILGLALGAALACPDAAPPRPPPVALTRAGDGASGPEPTFHRDVAPIVFRHCAPCHRPQGYAPFPLIRYEDVRARAPGMLEAVTKGRMPPWLPLPAYNEVVRPRPLRDAEIDTLRRWTEGGRLEGDPRDAPPSPIWAEGWTMGPPDLVVEMADDFEVPTNSGALCRDFAAPLRLPAARYVEAVELRFDNPWVVQHAELRLDGNDLVLRLAVRPGGPSARLRAAVGLHLADRPRDRVPVLMGGGAGRRQVALVPGGKRRAADDRCAPTRSGTP